jgi:hypothetical protein
VRADPDDVPHGEIFRNRSVLPLMRARGESTTLSTMMSANTQIIDLAERHSNDLDVVLMWGRESGRLWVNVTHRCSGRVARIDATPVNALDVFNHPLCYAPEAA